MAVEMQKCPACGAAAEPPWIAVSSWELEVQFTEDGYRFVLARHDTCPVMRAFLDCENPRWELDRSRP
jgi:hypothetical protein